MKSHDATAPLIKIAAECHRRKWQFATDDEIRTPAAEARGLVKAAFNVLHNIGDMAHKAAEELRSAPQPSDPAQPVAATPRGCICQDQHRRGYCTEPGCPYSDVAATPSTVRYSFDDMSFGLTNNGNKIDCKLVARPQGLANEAWYRFASDLIHILTIDPDAAASRDEIRNAALEEAALYHDGEAAICRAIALCNRDNDLGAASEIHAIDHEIAAKDIREMKQ